MGHQSINTLVERAHARRKKRRKRLKAVMQASAGQLIAERSEIVDWFDRLPLKKLRAVHRAAVTQFGEKPWADNLPKKTP